MSSTLYSHLFAFRVSTNGEAVDITSVSPKGGYQGAAPPFFFRSTKIHK